MISALESASSATYTATYSGHSTGGSPLTITVEQLPPDFLVKVVGLGGSEIIHIPGHVYDCSSTGLPEMCLTFSPGQHNPLSSTFDLYAGRTVQNALSTLLVRATSVSFSTSTVAGLNSTCATWGAGPSATESCVATNGVVTSYTVGQNDRASFRLTRYDPSASKSSFAPAGGARIEPYRG